MKRIPQRRHHASDEISHPDDFTFMIRSYCIGLTGSIASGKSTVAACFAALGVDVISADAIAKALVEPGQPALQQIIEHFGEEVLTPQGELNRRDLRERIVKQPVERAWLEACLHQLSRQQIQHDIHQCKPPYCIIEIPLLTDRLHYPYLNRVLLVQGVRETQITRLIARDHQTREQACALLATTHQDEDKRQAIADDKIMNNGSMDALREKVSVLHAQYLNAMRRSKTR